MADIRIKTLDRFVTRHWLGMRADRDCATAFPDLHESPAPIAASAKLSLGFSIPVQRLLDGFVWTWLRWHQCGDLSTIRDDIRPVLGRGVDASCDPKAYQGLRDDNDSLLIQLATIAAHEDLLGRICGCVATPGRAPGQGQYLYAWTEVLKWRILGDRRKERASFKRFAKLKPNRIFAWPTNKLVETFVDRDYKAFHTVLKRSCEKQWTIAKRDRAIKEYADGRRVFDPARKHKHFFWPWVEAAFAKLALRDGAEIKYDSFWLPRAMLED